MLIISSIMPMFGIHFVTDEPAKASDITPRENWTYFINITIDHDFINGTLKNFPVLVRLNDTIADKCNNGNIRFFNYNMSDEFPYEIDKWVDNEERLVWVKVSEISSTTDTTFRMYYSNATAAAYTVNSSEVWDRYVAVYHLSNKNDSTWGDEHNLTLGGGSFDVASKCGGGWEGDGNDGVYTYANDSILDVTPMTIEAWAKSDAAADNDYVMSNGGQDGASRGFFMDIKTNFFRGNIKNPNTDKSYLNAIIHGTDNNWRYVVLKWDGGTSNNGFSFVDGEKVDSSLPVGVGVGAPRDLQIGSNSEGVLCWDGIIDEVRVSEIVRSDAWINATYNTVNNSTGFMTFGGQKLASIIYTNAATGVGQYSATLNGFVDSNGGKTSRCGFVYGMASDTYLWNITNSVNIANRTAFSNNTVLNRHSTKYYYRAWLHNNEGYIFGEEQTFTTSAGMDAWTYYMNITINNTMIKCDLYNFTVCVRINDTIGDMCDGGIIRFYNDSDRSQECYHETEKWVDNEERIVWVKVPVINDTVDTTFCMFFNSSNAALNYNSTQAWDDNFVGVYHLGETSGDYADSTANYNNGSNVSLDRGQTGKIGECPQSSNTNARVKIPNDPTLSITGNITLSGWVYYTSGSYIVLISKSYTKEYELYHNIPTDQLRWYRSNNKKEPSIVENVSRWWYIAVSNNGTNSSFYSDGELFSVQDDLIGTASDNPVNLFNRPDCANFAANGYFDEMRISNTSRSECWINASYHTQNNSTGFMTFGELSGVNLSVITDQPSSVEELTATLEGTLFAAGGVSVATIRFQLNDTTPPIYTTADNTTNQSIASGNNFSQAVSGLTPGHLYHYRAYANNSLGAENFGSNVSFLTKPNASTGISLAIEGGGFNVSWTNQTGANTTVLVFKTTGYPADPSDGTVIYNGTDEYYVHSGLTEGTKYFYRIWASANYTYDGTLYHQFSDGNISTSRYFSLSPVVTQWPDNATVTTNSATLKLIFDIEDDYDYTLGFWVGCAGATKTSFYKNYTLPGTYNKDNADPYGLGLKSFDTPSELQPGQYYYIRAWAISPVEMTNSSTVTYMIMKPNPPTNVQATVVGGDSIKLSWAEFTPPACVGGTQSNRSTVIRYSSTSYPNDPLTSGTLFYNGTTTPQTVSGLSADTTYYFSFWTYVNDSGSPLLQTYSSAYSTVSADTQGGNYTISIRYENVSYGLVPLTLGHYHQFIVHYDNKTEFNYWDGSGALITTGTYKNESSDIWDNSANGVFSFNASSRPLWLEFHWNDTLDQDYRCNRIIIPQVGQRNVTFYIQTSLRVFRESTFTINDSLVKYAYSFVDETGKFNVNTNALAEIFFYNSSGSKIIVHSEYWDTELKMYPWLVYGKKYFIGVYCDALNIPNLGIAPSEQNEEPQIIIPFEYVGENNFFEYIELDIEWVGNSIVLTYLDTDYSSTNVTLKLYYYNNTTLMNTAYYNDLSSFVHSWGGLNRSHSYKIEVIVVNGIWPNGKSSGLFPFFGIMELSVSSSTINSVLETIFGRTPMISNVEGVEREVEWVYIGIFGMSFILLVSFGKLNAFLGSTVVGMWLLFANVAITGIDPLPNGAVLAAVGIFIIVLSIVGLLGGVEHR